MARTNGRFFEYKKNLSGGTGKPTPIKVRIANGATLKLGQAARINTDGYVVPAGAGKTLTGIVVGFIDNKGTPVNAFMFDSNKTGHTNSGDDTITAPSDNQSRSLAVFAEVMVGLDDVLFQNDANGDFAQTNLFQFFDVISTSDQIDQASASDTNGQFQLIEIDPEGNGDMSKGLFRVAETQLLSYHNSNLAVNVA